MTSAFKKNSDQNSERWHLIYYWSANQLQRVRHSKIARYVLVSCILGLSLARLSHSLLLASFSVASPTKNFGQSVTSADGQKIEIVDPSVAMGGALFQKDAVNSPSTNAPIEAPTKPFKLTGTLEGSPEFARALIEVQGEGIREYCSAAARNDCTYIVQNAKIVSIAKEHIWIIMGGVRSKLSLGQSSSDIKVNANQVPGTKPAENQIQNSEGEIVSKVISRENVLKILGGEGRMFEGQFGSYVINGKIEGYKISKISDEHIFAKLGAKNGDIIRRVNGYALNDLERLMDLYKALRTMPEAKIEIERNGKPVTYVFQIRN